MHICTYREVLVVLYHHHPYNIAVATYPRVYVRPVEKHELGSVTSTFTMSCNVLLQDCTGHIIVVDHLTRMTHFVPCTENITVEETATLFLQGVYRLHELPRVLVSDRDPKFVRGFWQTLWRRLGTRLNMSSSRHPETDGLTERVNNTFQKLLRCLCCYDGCDWTTLLPQVELAYNASRALGIEHTPFEANFGFSLEEPHDVLFSMRPSIPVSQDAI
jgi:hypothetical protein